MATDEHQTMPVPPDVEARLALLDVAIAMERALPLLERLPTTSGLHVMFSLTAQGLRERAVSPDGRGGLL